jgi:serine/threonine-protein kinase
MGEVYRARDTRLDRDVAIKVLPGGMASDPGRLARFEREAKVLASINHPHIATIFGLEESPAGKALVMELVDGETLKSPLPVAEALRLAIQIATALEAAHERGITHRDLKPANIMVTRAGIKLLDFGLAKPATRDEELTVTETESGTIVGTASYMSPEQAQGRAVDARSDIFSFGALLYEMISGLRAFPGDSLASTLVSVLRDEPTPLHAPAEVQSIVTRCLRKAAADRYQSATDLNAALEQAAQCLGRTQHTPSIAILPFASLSADKDNEYFGDGLAEEILNALTQVPGLRVIARASAFAFRGRENAIAEIGERLKVTHVLHGSVRRADSRIRVTAHLIDVSDETQLWAERYDRELRDVFDIQDEIAQAIVAQLKVRLGAKSGTPLVKRYTGNLEAHNFYLRGAFHVSRLTNSEVQRGLAYLEKAVALDPNYAPALYQLADYHVAMGHRGFRPLEHWPKVRALAARAIEADPEFADAHAALGFAAALCDFQWKDALRRLDGALQLNPACAQAHFWRSIVLFASGSADEALAAVGRATELDPLRALFHTYRATYSLLLDRPEQALEHARRSLEVDEHFPAGIQVMGEALSLLGSHEEGAGFIERTSLGLPAGYFYSSLLAWVYVRSGRNDDAERLRAGLVEAAQRQYIPAATNAFVAAALGDRESALQFAEQAVRERDPNLALWIRSRYFGSLRSDARFDRLLGSLNLGR